MWSVNERSVSCLQIDACACGPSLPKKDEGESGEGGMKKRDRHFHFLAEPYAGQGCAVMDNNETAYIPTLSHREIWLFSSHCLL